MQPFYEAERNMSANIFSEIKKSLGTQSESIILFGSVARKEETFESDFDICIVYKGSKSKLEESVSSLRDSLGKKYGVTLAPFYISQTEFKHRAKSGKSPIHDILKDGKVICGKSMERLIHG